MAGNDDAPFGGGPLDDDPLGAGPDGEGDESEASPLGEDAAGTGEPVQPAAPPPDPAETASLAMGGDFLDGLRDAGEKAVGEEIESLQQAMQRVDRFSEAFGDHSVEALQAEWLEIEQELKQALRSGLSAAEAARSRPVVGDAEEVEALQAEVRRKNDLISQLSDTVSRLNREMDESERRLRDQARGLREKSTAQGEELEELRTWSDELELREGKLRSELQTLAAERDELSRTASRATETLEAEGRLQAQRQADLEAGLAEAQSESRELAAANKELERRLADAERRLASAEEARSSAEAERDRLRGEADQAGRRFGEVESRLAEIEQSSSAQRKKGAEELERLRRSEGRWKAEAETSRSRLGEVLGQLRSAVSLLDALPGARAARTDEAGPSGPDPEADEASGPGDED